MRDRDKIKERKMIDGVNIKRLKVIADERGRLMEILRKDDDLFKEFGQVYMTTTYPEVVKAWHLHKKQTDNLACLKGMIKIALYDGREGSATYKEVNEYYAGIHNPILIQVPAGVYHGWMCISEEEAVVVNIPTELYNYEDPDEHRLDPHQNDIPYEWKRKDG
jgi:dTDP-4-dehydrorhamnose 3,5-epimerase